MKLMNFLPKGSHEMLRASNQQRKILMANPLEKAPENVPGAYYNDTTCIDCDLCREMAPQFFKRQDDGGYTYVFDSRGNRSCGGCPDQLPD
jgi:ferredoxin